MNWDDYECDGQMDIFEVLQEFNKIGQFEIDDTWNRLRYKNNKVYGQFPMNTEWKRAELIIYVKETDSYVKEDCWRVKDKTYWSMGKKATNGQIMAWRYIDKPINENDILEDSQ